MENSIIKFIEDTGPVTGSELVEAFNDDPLRLLRACRLSKDIIIRTIGTRYLRFDRKIEGYARLSPSILREFLTYSVIGLSSDQMKLDLRADEILMKIEDISRVKSDLAYNVVSSLTERLGDALLIKERTCFIIAGDIVFNMAHDVPRPERSTGKMVRGSDMDIVVIVDDLFPKELMNRLDEEIYREKYSLLLNPYMKEEIDYIVKDFATVREQVKFDMFKHMVACKILYEGTLLYGSEEIFHTVKTMLRENNVIDKINAMEESAKEFRKRAEDFLVRVDPANMSQEDLNLFYPAEESEEFV